MHPLHILRALALAVLALALLTPASFAQGTTIAVLPIWKALEPYILAVLAPLAVAIVGILAELVRRKLNLDIEARHREALQTALTNAAGLAISQIGAALADRKVDVRSPVIAAAVNYVIEAAPDAVRKFGLTPEALAEKVAAKIPQVAQPPAA